MFQAFLYAADRPWAITSEAYKKILEIATHENEFDREAVEARLGKPLRNTYTVTVDNGIGVLPVEGSLFKKGNLFTEISGATSLGMLMRDFAQMQASDDVRAIILNVDSPGGELSGVNEFSKYIASFRDKGKPVVAYVDGQAASGAYWIASAAEKIIADETALVGSIGVVATFRDSRERDEKSGVKTYEIVSSQSPNKRVDVATKEGRATVEALVDSLASEFVTAVATYRGKTEKDILSDFGKGGQLTAREGLKVGMIDELGSMEGVKAALRESYGKRSKSKSFGGTAATDSNNSKGEVMEKEKLAADQPGTAATPVDVNKLVAEAKAEGVRQGRAEGIAGERARFGSILGSTEASGRFELAMSLATDTDLTAEQVIKSLSKAPKAVEVPTAKETADSEFAREMAKVGNPKVGIEPAGAVDQNDVDAEVDKILKAGTR